VLGLEIWEAFTLFLNDDARCGSKPARLRYRVSFTKEWMQMAVWRRPGLLWQSSPGVPSGVMVFLRVLARTGRLGCRRPCASYSPS
jgi:hypothetical protein